ncbi:hypothetical protein OPT61_g4856 [Boeremia exigua]|uniref:Uncharacterized protein n=1 Tax=Boeremia exigua TaxID=749465 RepID=A0ACC2ICP0_9PLEO|nr:hypothetical protein OPT61_g4856 [Boeremia exigua]
MSLPLYFFPDHEPFFGNAPTPTPMPLFAYGIHDVTRMLSKLIKAFTSPVSRHIMHHAVQEFYCMNAEVAEHPFFWCWYIDHHIQQLVSAGIIDDRLLLPLEITDYRSWSYDPDIPILLTRLRMYNKTFVFYKNSSMKDREVIDFNIQHHASREVVFQRPKRLDGEARVVAKGMEMLDTEDLGKDGSDCAICTEAYRGNAEERGHEPVMATCRHTNGAACILRWLPDHDTCPICRRRLV